MKKYISYFIFLIIVLFGGIGRVNAASELLCLYQNPKDSNYKYYLYQANDVKPYVVLMQKSSKGYYVYGKIKLTIKKGNLDDEGYLKGCPKADYVTVTTSKVTIKKNADLTASNHVSTYANKGYTAWSCNYDVTDNMSLKVEQNKYGMITYSYTKNGKSYDGKKLLMNGQTYGSSTCPTYFKNKTYSADSEATFYYKLPDNVSDYDCVKCSGSGCSQVDNNSGVSGNEQCGVDGKNCEYSELLENKEICIYENAGYCSSRCLGNYCEPNHSACSLGLNASDVNYRFRNSSYMLFTYNNLGKIDNVFLPKSTSSNEDLASRISAYRDDDAEGAYLADLFDHFDTLSNVDTQNNIISAIQSWNLRNVNIKSCPSWFNGTSGYEGDEYATETYAWKRIDLTLEDLDNDTSENPDGVVSGDEFEGTKCDVFCEYNNGNFVMKFSVKNNNVRIMVYSPEGLVSSSIWSYIYGSANGDITWKSADGLYGETDGANNGKFEDLMVGGTCPAKLKYDPFNKKLFICDKESDCEDDNNHYSAVEPKFSQCEYQSYDGDYSTCKDLIGEDLLDTLNEYFLLFRLIVPGIVVLLGIVDFAKAMFASGEDNMKKSKTTFMKRLVIGVVIFLIPTFVNLLLKVANIVWGWNADACDIGVVEQQQNE